MSLDALIERLESLQIECRADGDQLRVSAPDGALTPELIDALKANKAALLAHLMSFGAPGLQPREHTGPEGPALQRERAPLSLAQERLWFLETMGGVGAAYHVAGALRIHGALDAASLTSAFEMVQQRQGQLRVRFIEIDGRPVQQESDSTEPLTIREWHGDASAAIAAARADAQVPFEVMGGPLVRATLHRIAADDHVLAVTVHHLICDGASLSILIRELMDAYASVRASEAPRWPVLRDSYLDLAAAQRDAVSRGSFDREVAYWRGVLADAPDAITLPADHPRPAATTFAGATETVEVPASLTSALSDVARTHGATPFMVWLAAWAIVLMRTSGQDDVVIGVPVSNRPPGDAEELVGLFVNALPIRVTASAEATGRDLIAQVKTQVLDALDHSGAPWEFLLDALQPRRDVSRSPIFQVSFTLQDHPAAAFDVPGLRVEDVPTPVDASKFELSLELQPTPDGRLSGILEFNRDLFTLETVQRLIARLRLVAEALTRAPEARLRELDMLSPGEFDQLRSAWCGERVEFETELSVVDRLRVVAAEHPGKVAVAAGDRALTFGELEGRVAAVARDLVSRGVGVGCTVGVLVDRSPDTIANLIGVMAAGAAYVPIDPSWPEARRVSVEQAAGCALVISPADAFAPVDVKTFEWPRVGADDAAYVLFTSGSTGVPKGVVVEHRSLRHLIEALDAAVYQPLGISTDARVSVNGALTFDTSVKQVFQLLKGRTLVLIPEDVRLDGQALLDYARRLRVDVLDATPSQLTWLVEAGLADAPGSVRAVLAGGEALSASLWQRMRKPGAPTLVNLYGPTECTVDATAHILRADDEAPLLGRPLPNIDVLVLDADLRPAPVGVAGEIVIGGPGVARGYLGDEVATTRAFVPRPFEFVNSSRVYRTGDRGRVRADGRLEFLGRVDDQVKIRGHRVELGDIEQALTTHQDVRAASALIVDDERLVAAVAVDPLRAPVADGRDRYTLPNGLSIVQLNPNETDFLYREMFERNAYLRHGVHLRDEAVVVDVGSNIGMFAMFANAHHAGLKFLCVEPNPHVRTLLQGNLRLFGVNALVYDCGISSEEGTADFTFYSGFSILSGLHADLADEKAVVRSYIRRQQEAGEGDEAAVEEILAAKLKPTTLPVRLRPLGDILDECGIRHIDLLKINVEKAELEVLLGLRESQWASIRQIALELHDEHGRLDTTLALLHRHGFEVFVEEDWSLEHQAGTNYYLYATRPGEALPQPELSSARLAQLTPAIITSDDIRAHVQAALPEYMVPEVVAVVDRLPVTAHGKVDRRQLARWSWTRRGDAAASRELTPDEARLAALWRDVLSVESLGPDSHFFNVGGHSLSAARLAVRVRDTFGVPFTVGAVFEHPVLADMAAHVAPPADVPGDEYREEPVRPARPRLTAHGLEGPHPLSFAQARLLFLEQLDGGGSAYVIAGALALDGALDRSALQRAVNDVVERHPVLRSVFPKTGGEPVASLIDAQVTIDVTDWSDQALRVDDGRVREWVRAGVSAGFALDASLPLRLSLLALSAERHVLVVACHHLVADGWSVGVFLRDLSTRYSHHAAGQPGELPPLPVTYYDYARWQREWLSGAAAASDLEYWKRALEGASPALELPTDRPRPSMTSYDGASISWQITSDLRRLVETRAKQIGATPYMVWLSAFSALLHRWSGQQDVVIGSPVAGRTVAGADDLVGLFVNTVVLRLDFESTSTFATLLDQARTVVRGALDHQDVPFEHVVEAIRPPRRLDRHPVFQVMFALQNLPQASLELPGVRWEPIHVPSDVARFDLSLVLDETDDGYRATFEYATALFDESTIARLVPQLERLVRALCGSSEQRIATARLTTSEDFAALRQWNATEKDFGPFVPMTEQVWAWAERTPDAPALTYQGQVVSFGELRRRSRHLTAALRAAGLPRHGVAAIYTNRAPAWIASLLGILDAGGVFLPIDPEFPAERVAWMLEDSGTAVVVTQRATWLRLVASGSALPQVPVIFVEDIPVHGDADTAAGVTPLPDDPAYLIYTSGSTGRPKGALNAHRGFVNLISNFVEIFDTSADSQSLHFSSISFDSSLCEVFMGLAIGGTVVLAERDEILPGEPLESVLRDRGVTHATIPPSALGGMLDPDLPKLQVLLSAGEACTPEVVQRWAGPRRFYNAYGPTESAVCSVVRPCRPGETRIPIGRPLFNVTAYVLDQDRQVVPIGVPGELAIGGVGVAIGYWNRPELTAERFVEIDPYGTGERVRVYLTGDQTRYLADGDIEFLGRKDTQIKLRGYRIELGEIESAFRAHPSVRDCAVVVQSPAGAQKRLVAFIVSEGEPVAVKALKDHLRTRLPEYMVPPIVVTLDRIPQTTAGKRHTKVLEQWDVSGVIGEGDAPTEPVSETAEALAGVFADVLDRESFPPHADFFEQGGHSLLAARIIGRVRERLGVELTLRALFEAPTPVLLASRLDQATSSGWPPVRPAADRAVMSAAQRRLWFIDQLQPSEAYTIVAAVRIQGWLDLPRFTRAVESLSERHSVLCSIYPSERGEPWMQILDAPIALSIVDVSAEEMDARAARDARVPFDLAAGPLFRPVLYRAGDADFLFVASMHHIVSDGWSVGVLVRDLADAYAGTSAGAPLQYGDYAAWWQNVFEGAGSARLEEQLDYWRQRLAGVSTRLDLPPDYPRPAALSSNGGSVRTTLDAQTVETLKSAAASQHASLFVLLHAAFSAWLSRLSNQSSFIVGTPVANRRDPALENVVGLFVNTLPLRVQVDTQQSFANLVAAMREQVVDDLSHPDVPFDLIVQAIQPERDLSRSPLFQVMFAMGTTLVPPLTLGDLRLTPAQVDIPAAKFDLTLFVDESAEGLECTFEYNADVFAHATAKRWLAGFTSWLTQVIAQSERPLSSLPFVSDAELAEIESWNGALADETLPSDLALDMFEAQVGQHPERVAVEWRGGTMSFAVLDARANQLARHLRAYGIGPDTLIGVCLERTSELVVSLLAIWKAGGAYLPIDPQYPPDRINFMVRDASTQVVITTSAQSHALSSEVIDQVSLVLLDVEAPRLAALDPSSLGHLTAPNELAYVIYTSGSTGLPKGVLIEHSGLANYLAWAVDAYRMTDGAGVPVAGSIGFDATITSLFGPLVVGQRIILVPEGAEIDALSAREQKADHTLWKITPSHLDAVNAQLAGIPLAGRVRHLVVGGEALAGATIRLWAATAPDTLVTNEYGPTETVVGCVVYTRRAAEITGDIVPIGRPIANTEILVLDDRREPVPVGVVGEMYIAGAGVARGYLNRHELTDERFVELGIRRSNGAHASRRAYRTGDLVRWNAEGQLEFLGRRDTQVKIRGHRIELGEIEAVALRDDRVAQAAAMVDRSSVDTRLVLCLVPRGDDVDLTERVSVELRRSLPSIMVPAEIAVMPALPLTPNGKLDRDALVAQLASREQASAGHTSRTFDPSSMAGLVAAAWTSLLGAAPASDDQHFFDAGGHSLLAAQLVAALRDLCGVSLPVRTVFDAPTFRAMTQAVQAARDAGRQLPPIVRQPDTRVLSHGQQRLWAIEQFDDAGDAYHVPAVFEMRGAIDVDALRAAWRDVLLRHDALRLTIPSPGGHPRAEVLGHAPDLQVSRADNIEAARQIASGFVKARFDLERGPLVRAALVSVADDLHVFAVVVHHLVFDGWSSSILARDLSTAYQSRLRGDADGLTPLFFQYTDYAKWQRDVLSGETRERLTSFWRQELDGAPPVLELPLDRPRPIHQRYEGAVTSLVLDGDLRARIDALARAHHVTPYMVMMAAWANVLGNWSQQHDLVIGTTMANRDQPGTSDLIGFFVNTLPVRLTLDPAAPVSTLLSDTRDAVLRALDHQLLPFDEIVEVVAAERNPAVPPVVQALFTYQRVDEGALVLPGVEASPVSVEHRSSKFDVTLAADDHGDAIELMLEYRSDLFDKKTIAGVLRRVECCLDAMTTQPADALSSLSLVTTEDVFLLRDWNDTSVAWTDNACLHQAFERQALLTQDSVALLTDDAQMTYAELDARASACAARFIEAGVGRDRLVGVYIERSFELFIALFGILKAGGAYVPLDPEYPEARLAGMVEDAAMAAVVTTDSLRERMPNVGAVPVIVISLDEQPSASSLTSQPRDEDLAYCIFTSGSTGRPKGAAISHGAIRNRLLWMQQFDPIGPGDVVLHKTPISFDVSVWELFWPLMVGASIAIAKPGGHRDAAYLAETMRAKGVTTAHFVPSMLQVFLEEPTASDLPGLKRVFASGEALSWETARRFADRVGCPLHNLYGPTEAAVDVTAWTCVLGEQPHAIPIGRPIANTRIHVLDERLERVPVGVPGELCIGGVNLARGYVNRPELTAERFIQNPFAAEPGEGPRLYRTGDRARWRSDGQIEYLGRLDSQIKLRGFRIELGEIETALMQHSAVAEAAVNVVSQRLIAYIVPARGQAMDERALRTFVRDRVPDYMVPSAFMAMAALPLGPSGKLDRRALPVPVAQPVEQPRPSGAAAPETSAERALAAIWRDVLDVRTVDVESNFFELGGDSLRAIQVAARARAAGLSMTPALILEHQTVRTLAAATGPAAAVREASGETGLLTGPVPAPPIVHWFAELGYSARHHFNQAIVLETPVGLSADTIERALRLLTGFHDSLRLRGSLTPSHLALKYGDVEGAGTFRHATLASLGARDYSSVVESMASDLQASLDPATGPLWRAVYITGAADAPGRLIWVIHHLGVDGVSWGTLIADLARACSDLMAGRTPDLSDGLGKPVSWRQWSVAWKAAADAGVLDGERDYWAAQIANHPRPLARPDNAPVTRRDRIALPAGRRISQDEILAALWTSWRLQFSIDALTVDLESHGRVAPDASMDVSRTVGWFTAVYPLSFVPVAGDNEQAIVSRTLASVPRSGVGFGVLKYLAKDPVLAASARPPVLFNFLGQMDAAANVDGWAPASEDTGPSSSPHNRSPYMLELVAGITNGTLELHWHSPASGLGQDVLDRLADAVRHELGLGPIDPGPWDIGVDLRTLDPGPSDPGPLSDPGPVSDLGPSWSPLVRLSPGDGPPIFLVHPAGGTVSCYAPLARLLDRAVYGLQAPGLEAGQTPIDAVEPLARVYVEAIAGVCPDGPIHLGGWSYGGVVAYEIARQWRARGRAVESLIIFDTLAPGAMPEDEWRKSSATLLADIFGADAGVSSVELAGYPLDVQLAHVVTRAIQRGALPPEFTIDDARRAWTVFQAHRRAEQSYRPEPMAGDALVFSSDLRRDDADKTMGWGRWLSSVRIVNVPGTHLDVLRPPVVQTVADVILDTIAARRQ